MSTDAERWATAPGLPSLAALCIEWFNGDITGTPIYEGTPCEDMRAIAPHLTALNRAGLVTCSASAAGTEDGNSWSAWAEGFCTAGTLEALKRAVAGTSLILSAADWNGPCTAEVSEDWEYWIAACPKAADALRAALFVTLDGSRPGDNGEFWDVLRTFAASGVATW